MRRTTYRVRRQAAVVLTLRTAVSRLGEAVGDTWKLACAIVGVTLGAVVLLGTLARAVSGTRLPRIDLWADPSTDAMLLQTHLPRGPETLAPLGASVVSILRIRQHAVRAGETLSQIAERYDLRIGTLIDFNGIRNARTMPAGQTLSIPNTDGLRYVVRRGDSLGKIGRLYGVSVNALRDWNDLQSDTIRPGQQLFLPGASMAEDDIKAVLGTLFIYPAVGRFTSGFGMRLSPITGTQLFHNGIDLANRVGTPVAAARSGRVAEVDAAHPIYGRMVLLTHGGGYQTLYAHLDTILVRRGQNVGQGERIGTMGATGAAVGTHLHFTVFKNQTPVDPLTILP